LIVAALFSAEVEISDRWWLLRQSSVQQERAELERAKEQQTQLIDSQKDELRQSQLDLDKQKVFSEYTHSLKL